MWDRMGSAVMQLMSLIGGVFLLLAGAVLLPLPLPLGAPLIAVALLMLAPYVPPLRRRITALRERFPGLDRFVRRHQNAFPKFLQKSVVRTRPRRKRKAAG
ncbi:MAG: hypothetical protein AAF337_04000 [Pseudomonadota bacterium]